jgi:branched-chain amino acid aminotransferase
MFINFNGKILEANTAIIAAQNRGLRFGDGLFETIKLKNNHLIFFEAHFARLQKGLAAMQFQMAKTFTEQFVKEQVLHLAKKNKLTSARVRLTIVRGNGGLYDAESHAINYIIEAIQLPNDDAILNSNGLDLCIYNDAKKAIDSFSNYKHNNFLPYSMGALYAKQQKCNDAIILNTENNIADTTIANLFYIKNGQFYTPALQQGCVAGIVRQFLVAQIQKQGFSVHETQVSVADLQQADEVFLTNSIYNIRWVKTVENTNYGLQYTQQLVQKLIRNKTELYL